MYQPLIRELEERRAKTARFRKVALHVHSPDSHDWGDRPHAVAEVNARERFAGAGGLQVFADEIGTHVEVVAITDHMRCSFASNLSKHTNGKAGVAVLPGMEVNIRLKPPLAMARIHVLAILPESSTAEAFSRLFAQQNHIPDDRDRTGQEEVDGIELKDWVDRVHQEAGIVIAAHIESKAGIRLLFRQVGEKALELFSPEGTVDTHEVPQEFRDYILRSGIDAIEISKGDASRHFRWTDDSNGQYYSIPALLTFDAHCVEDFARPRQMTHIKMTTTGLKGLKEALRFSDTRIRYPGSVPDSPLPRLLGIRVTGDVNAFFADLTVAFAENLNCVIGVRGSGKSTLVEALRYVFGYNRTLNEIESLGSSARERQAKNLTGSSISVAYRTATGEDRILSATYDPKEDYVTKVQSVAGEPLGIPDVEKSGEYPLRLFGWSEIENLGRDPARQRDLLDRLVPAISPLLQKREELRNSLASNRAKIVKSVADAQAAFAMNNGEVRRFKGYTDDFQRLNSADVRALFTSMDLTGAKSKAIKAIESQVVALNSAVDQVRKSPLTDPISPLVGDQHAGITAWWNESGRDQVALDVAVQAVEGSVTQLTDALTALQLRLRTQNGIIAGETAAISLQLQTNFAGDASTQRIIDLRTNAAKRLERCAALRDEYLKALSLVETQLGERRLICTEVLKVQQEISDLRDANNRSNEDTLNKFLPDQMQVGIRLVRNGDKVKFGERISTLTKGPRTTASKRCRAAVECLLDPVSMGDVCIQDDLSTLVGRTFSYDGASQTVAPGDIESIDALLKPFDVDDGADAKVMTQDGKTLLALVELQEVRWDDQEMILLNGIPVNERSPGQRSSAMLPLIALAEKTPLVIDQPEDNLDKRLVGTVLMKVLASLKETRQIIVCTHDPNILVGGDAEQVVVLEAEHDRRASVVTHGSIDNEEIVDTVIDLLEGGQAAFDNRRKRYELHQ